MDIWDKLRYLAEKNEVGSNLPFVRPCDSCTEQECRCFSVFDTDRLDAKIKELETAENLKAFEGQEKAFMTYDELMDMINNGN